MDWKIEQCDFEGAKIMETRYTGELGGRVRHDPEQVASISMATPEAIAMIAAAPAMLAALKTLLYYDLIKRPDGDIVAEEQVMQALCDAGNGSFVLTCKDGTQLGQWNGERCHGPRNFKRVGPQQEDTDAN